jgi:hypothetical protein
VRNIRYLAFVRSFSCAVCESTRQIEAAHTGPHGLGQKSSDLSTIPLCLECHIMGKFSLHKLGPVKFAAFHQCQFAFPPVEKLPPKEEPETPGTSASAELDGVDSLPSVSKAVT